MTNIPVTGNYSTQNNSTSTNYNNFYTLNTAALTPSSGLITNNYNTNHAQLTVKGDMEVDGNIKWKGRNLENFLQAIENRLAILSEQDPEKLEQFAALKKAYDQYKILEALCGVNEK